MLIDSHCHLDFPALAKDAGVVSRARAAGVSGFLTICTRLDKFDGVRAAAAQADDIWCTVGVHPHEASGSPKADAEKLAAMSDDPKVVGFGETGLDFYYDHSPRDAQAENFRVHIAAAQKTGLPVVIHTRDADEVTDAMLRQAVAEKPFGGVLHCFSSGEALARTALELGLYISISGIVTFKTADALRDIVRWFPVERMLVETDAPFLAPMPHRGKTCEPAHVALTAAKVAEIKGMSVDALARHTTENFFRLFPKAQFPKAGRT